VKDVNVIITGFGTVGREAARLLDERRERYRTRYGVEVRLVGVARSRTGCYDDQGLAAEVWEAFARGELAGDPACTGADFLTRTRPDVLIETGPSDYVTGGAGSVYMKTALAQGTHVIAVSKGALVADYPGLAALAKKTGAVLKISGATAAALPTVDLLEYNLAGCEAAVVEGILTGTANFVLSSMMEADIPYEEAIRRAQELGIAEPDPRFDVEGWDTACKLTIIANTAFGAGLRLDDVKRTGIAHLTRAQMDAWRQVGRVPKLVGSIRRTAEGVKAAVELRLYGRDHPFARVHGTTKAIRVETDAMGELLVIGGKSDPRAAAAAALKDLEHILQAFD
jgi:homoserine dehydrogenase